VYFTAVAETVVASYVKTVQLSTEVVFTTLNFLRNVRMCSI